MKKASQIKSSYTIILFYKYVAVKDPEKLADRERTLCSKLGLKGRFIIAHEGINATLEGKTKDIKTYCAALLRDPRFKNTHIKKSDGTKTGTAFPRLSVKVRPEIVSLGLSAKKDINPRKVTGKRITPAELHKWLTNKDKNKKDFEIIDMRNTYEHKVGHFKGSILPPLENFRDLQKVVRTPALKSLKKKTIVTVCTGGVRCEKASGFLIKNGFKDVYQLDGGIVSYMEKFEKSQTKNFLGSLYVFDERVTMAFAPKDKRVIVGTCEFCDASCERYINCANNDCHRHFIVCEKCLLPTELCPQCSEK